MKDFKKVYSKFLNLAKKYNIDLSDIDFMFCSLLDAQRCDLNNIKTIRFIDYLRAGLIFSKRKRGVPLDQILHESYFYGFSFYVNKYVLAPRPETELLCERVSLEMIEYSKGLDIGTGSGAIAITLARSCNMIMTACDISNRALKVAKFNNKKNNTNVKFIESDLFKNIRGKFDFIVSNPPYIKTNDIKTLQTEVKDHEPIIALDGGKDGLDFYKKIIDDAPRFLNENGKIFFELGINQSNDVKKMLEKDFYDIIIKKDYSGIDRIIYATKK